MQKAENTGQIIKNKARELGFCDCAILPVDVLTDEKSAYFNWLESGMQGEMSYMERNIDKRFDPALLFENAKTIIVALYNYFPGSRQDDEKAPIISKYAYGIDYHYVLKEKLGQLLTFIQTEIIECVGRPFADSAPVLERAWAKKAGLGWIGKNSNLINLKQGSFIFICELLLDVELPYDEPKEVTDHCGNCTRCIDACPTKAIVADRVVDARKCISYQTIEKRGELDKELLGKFENRVFGCDICQDVCPWNLKAKPTQEPGFNPGKELMSLTRQQWMNMDKDQFNRLFKKSAVKRAGYKGLKRNIEFISTWRVPSD
ncbi:MAG: tRNA epoxyqueuosine(34) reductase QueG [Draconibacterium sp.]|nr:MAG: tRNA epoxyqueuosine(34) reductase QueG [Draconibacterium sp.]